MHQRSPLKVVVAGGGVAAAELVLALRELAGPRARVTLVAPNASLDIRALSTLARITGQAPPRLPLVRIAARAHARLERATVRRVLASERLVELGDNRRLPYDALVLATGARPFAAYGDGVATFGTEAGRGEVSTMLDDLRAGRSRSAAFVVPPGVAWTLPLYELALLAARATSAAGAQLSIVTPEEAPVAIFGLEAARALRAELAAAGIELHVDSYASIDTPGHVVLRPHGRVLAVDRIVALSRAAGRAPAGVPTDDEGFVAIDDCGRARDAESVYAIGDVTSFPVKQGGIACQLADAVASQLAALAGADVIPIAFRPVLRGQLLTGPQALHLTGPIAGGAGAGEAEVRRIWRPSHKVDARYLSRLLEHEPGFGIPPGGIAVAARLATPSELARDPLALDPYSPLSTAV